MIGFLFWVSLLAIFYTYFGYPIFLWCWGCFKKPSVLTDSTYPAVTVVIAARDEEACIGATVRSVLESDYPKERLDVLVISDGSKDQTNEIVKSFNNPRVQLLRLPFPQGKTKALATGVHHAKGDVLLLTDASCSFFPDTAKNLMRPFSDASVGSVVGRKTIQKSAGLVSTGDGLYWSYDAILRHWESRTGASWVGCEGGIFAIRKELLRFDFSENIAEDYSICCRVFERGYLNRYEPSAIVREAASKNIEMEFNRKIRVIVRGLLAFFAFRCLLNPIRYPGFFFQNMSHRFMRWLAPFFLLALFFSSAFYDHLIARFVFVSQSFFYLLAIVGFTLKYFRFKLKPALVPLYFVVVNAAGFMAWFFLFRKYAAWAPTTREQTEVS